MLLYKPDKTKADIEVLISEHKNLVYAMLGQLGQLYNQDAESVAWEALWDAIATFDIYTTTAFSTYACVLIRNAIKNEIRKAKTRNNLQDNSEIEEFADIKQLFDNSEASLFNAQITRLFELYIANKVGVIRNVMLCWYNSGFTATVSNLSIMCRTSTSYVSRVQHSFRAFLSSKLKEL